MSISKPAGVGSYRIDMLRMHMRWRCVNSKSCLLAMPGYKRRVVASRAFLVQASSDDVDRPDLVERLFGRLFGQTALENRSPGGMKRMSDEAMMEQYPATLTEFAEAVDSDDKTMQTFRPLLAQTRLEKLPLR